MSFAHAVIDPFNSDAYGAQVPDAYPFPTSTVTIKQSSSVVSDGNGNFDFAAFANPMGTIYSNNVNSVGAMTANWSQTTVSGGTPGNAIVLRGLQAATSMAAYNRWRVVGFGLRMRSLLVPLSSTGVFQMAVFPGPDRLMNATIANELLASTGQAGTIKWYNLPATDASGYFSTSIENYTTANRMEHFKFNQDGFEWSAIPTGPNAFKWRTGVNSTLLDYGGNHVNTGNEIVSSNVTSGPLFVDEEQFIKMDDWSMLIVRGTQFPASVNVADLEMIMHLEYIDANSSTLGGTGRFPAVDEGAVIRTQAVAARMPLYRSLPGNTGAQMQSRLGF